MPRDIGPDMLRNLDEQLAAGNIDLARYEARKVEVVELIRRGKAIEYSGGERLWRIGRRTWLLKSDIVRRLRLRA